jgi:ABC-type nitrate/sulfonate/bicarbonate transport system substrate-binding protein
MANPAHKAHQSEVGVSVKNRFALRRVDFLIVLVAVVLIAFWVVHRGNQAYEGLLKRPLRVGIVPWPGFAGGLVANRGLRPNKDCYFWDKRNLLVEFVEKPDEDELLRDFESGKLDVIWSTVDSLAQQAPALQKKGIHPKAFMQVDWSHGGDAIIASAGIDQIEDLKGKRIAVSPATSEWLFEYSLKNSSLSEDERRAIRQSRVQTKSPQDAANKFINNEVDAAVLWEPDVTRAITGRLGSHKLLDTKDAGKLIADIMVAKQEFIDQHHNAIVALIDGWIHGTTDAIKDPMLAVQYLQHEADFETLGPEKTHDMLEVTSWATLSDNAEMFGLGGGNAYFDILFKEANEVWVKAGYMSDSIPADQARDTGPLQEVYGMFGFHRSAKGKQTTCATPEATIETKILPVGFQPNKADLTDVARTVLSNNEALFVSNSNFCIQSDPVVGDNQPNAAEIARTRENAVIDYLRARYPRSQFASANTVPEQSFETENRRYVRLKLAATVNQP